MIILRNFYEQKSKKTKKKNPVAKLLRSPMLRNKIVKIKKKVYDRKKFKLENE
tara:strand:- start:90 stop:248 length:159 start_codon:yes stop_codon:yes gene_type:complete